MKKFLSLVLALVMTMSLVTISAGAKEFTDDDTITYDEAINVISTIGVVDGYADGSFRPTDVLTRGAAAKIICNLILGPTTAAELHATTAPYKDVPTSNTFAGYIAYCAKAEIISGYGDGTFRPSATLTGYAFMKMLLGALGYDAEIEGYVGPNWSISVAKRAKDVGLMKGLEGEFNGIQSVTRQDACLYAFNTLKADLVEYDTTISATINGETVTIGNSLAKAQQWNNSATRINNIKNDIYIQFAEQYFNKLVMKDDNDVFGRPAVTWVYDKKEIGTYVDYTTLVAEYTEKVTGKVLYDEITKSVLDDSKVLIYIDGEVDKSVLGSAYFTKGNIVKTNTEKVGKTGNGVLTQVFVDTDADEVIIAIINTYLAKAQEDYDEKNEDVELKVFSIDNVGAANAPVYVKDTDTDETIKVDNDDINVEDVEKNDLFLVTVADGEIQTIDAPEIVADATISNFKLDKYVTADGEKYDQADTARYDTDVLYKYDNINLKDTTYNVILDPYGYMIGLEQNEDDDNYLFLTGIDNNYSNLSNKNADANVIFLDGTMETVTVDTKKSNLTSVGSQANTWCTYTVSSSGVYTLKQVPTVMGKDDIAQSAMDARTTGEITIDKKHVSLDGSDAYKKVYGNDETVYLNVELDNIIDWDRNYVQVVDDVESITTGVKNVSLTIKNVTASVENRNTYAAPVNEVYALYDDDAYVIAAVTIGENDGVSSNFAYITDGVVRESYDPAADEWTWTKEAIVNGKVVELTEVGDTLDYLDDDVTEVGKWYEIKYDANGNVRGVKANDAAERYAITFLPTAGKFINNVGVVEPSVEDNDTVLLHVDFCSWKDYGEATDNAPYDTVANLVFEKGTLYTKYSIREGFSVSPDVNVVLSLGTDKHKGFDDIDDTLTGYDGLEKALRNLDSDKKSFNGFLSAILENGVATTIVLDDRTGSTVNQGVTDAGNGLTLTSASQNRFGFTSVSATYKRPEFVPESASIDVDARVYADGVYTETVTFNFDAYEDTARATLGGIYDEDEVITLSFVKYYNASAVKVLYKDVDNNKYISAADLKLSDGTAATTELATTGSNSINFKVASTDGTTSLSYETTGLSADETATTFNANTAVTISGKKASGTDYVVVKISNLSKLQTICTVTGIASGSKLGDLYSGTPTFAEDVTLEVSGASSAIDGSTISMTVTASALNGGNAGVSVTLSTGDVIDIPNNNTAVTKTISVKVDGDTKITVADVEEIAAPTVEDVEIIDNDADGKITADDTVIITLSEAVTPVSNLDACFSHADAASTVSGTPVLSADGDVVTVTLAYGPSGTVDGWNFTGFASTKTNVVQNGTYTIKLPNTAGAVVNVDVSYTK